MGGVKIKAPLGMKSAMQAHVHKKDKIPVIICPRCNAENLVIQSQCGKCGYVFPKDTPYKKSDAGRAMLERTPRRNPLNPMAPPSQQEMDAQEGEGGEEGGSVIPKPVRPKSIPERGASEGLRIARGKWLLCPRCGADVAQDAKRCSRCGWKPPAIV